MATKRASARRRVPRQARSQQTVDCILEAATRVFRRQGFRATTNRVASEAGVSIGSLYEYFPNKQALLAALAERHVALRSSRALRPQRLHGVVSVTGVRRKGPGVGRTPLVVAIALGVG